jgi:molecular chaperone GrpE (heat shock protein)
MSNPQSVPDEFTAAMQQLSAEAAKANPLLPKEPERIAPAPAAAPTPVPAPVDSRLEELEWALSQKIDEVITAVAQSTDAKNRELSIQFRKIEEQLAGIRNTEGVHQRLFDSLHDELIKYRDNFLHESLQKPFIHDLVHLFDDLSSLATQLRSSPEGQKNSGPLAQWRNNLENIIAFLIEILHRFEVMEVEPKDTLDRNLHRVVSYEPADYAEDDGRIVMRLKRGFFWRGKLIRPEEVIAKRYG